MHYFSINKYVLREKYAYYFIFTHPFCMESFLINSLNFKGVIC